MKGKTWLCALLCFVLTAVFVLPVSAAAVPLQLSLQVEKQLTGDTPDTAETFTFQLEPVDNAPMPDHDTVTIRGQGTAQFEEITYTQAGDYVYTVRETAGTAKGYTYDRSVYELTVHITCDKQGELESAVTVLKQGQTEKANGLVFVNRYDAPDQPTQQETPPPTQTEPPASPVPSAQPSIWPLLPQTGDPSNPAFWLVLCGVALAALVVLLLAGCCRRKKQKQQEQGDAQKKG